MKLPILLASIICLIFSTFLALAPHKLFKTKHTKPIYILLGGAFLSIFIILLYVDFQPSIHGYGTTFFLAIFHSIQVLLLGYDFEFLYKAIDIGTKYASFAYFYVSILFFLAPIYTFGFVLSFFESITSYGIYLWKWRSDIYILSELSEKSLLLAKSIRNKFPKAIIAFMSADILGDDTHEYIEATKEIRALRFKKDIAEVGLKFHSKTAVAEFFTISENESLNLENALSIIDSFRTRKNTELYVFSTSKEGELLLGSADPGEIKLRRVNEDRAMAYSIIRNNLITEHVTEADGRKIISTLIVGFGGYGSELAKALLWCGQLPGYDLEINIIDLSKSAEARFSAQCPEIMLLNRNTEVGEARYSIDFFCDTDVRTDKFASILSQLVNTSVVYISMGDDELNIETAINARVEFERLGLYPTIRAIVHSPIKYKTVKNHNLVNHNGDSYDIEIIGDSESRLEYDMIIDDRLEEVALECHLRWAKPEEREDATKQFNRCEYHRNSSIATAIHEKYRAAVDVAMDQAEQYEHMRWNAYMRTEGYIFSGSTEKASRNDRAKMHNNLHRFDLLCDDDIQKDRDIISAKNRKEDE